MTVRPRGRPWRSSRDRRGVARVGGDLLGAAYGLYALALSVLAGVALWPIVVVIPVSQRGRLAAVRAVGTILRTLVGVRLDVRGAVPRDRPVVVVANHGSFVDGLVLILSLRAPTTYVVGTAFAQQPLLGRFLSGLGCVFAGGGSPSGASEVIDQLTAVVRGGSTLVIFPEGGLSALPGLRRFRLGAFRVAAAAGVEVVPVGVRGTRAIVPPRQRRARPGAIVVEIGAPIMPAGTDWRTVVALRDTAQRAIALLSGEVVPQA